jgi:predicted nuclease of restriction endonuclease-like (RecB) superfamily
MVDGFALTESQLVSLVCKDIYEDRTAELQIGKGMSNKPVSLIQPPEGYTDWLVELRNRIHNTQQRATQSVNRELVSLYWQIGRDILVRQAQQCWGAKIIDRLAHDLHSSFPQMKGFSRANLMYMRAFAEAWPDSAIVQQAVGQLPWGHNLVLLTKLKEPEQRLAYARASLEYGWSRSMLTIHIETKLLERTGNAVTNFSSAFPHREAIWLDNHSRTLTYLIF